MAASITEDRGPQIAAVTYVMLVLATVAVALRFWARYIAHKSGFWFDDWALLAALPFVWASCALSIYWVSIGLGKHISQVPEPRSQLALVLFVVNFVYNTGLSLVKLSVLLFYIRIFKSIRTYRIAFWIVGIIIVGWCIAINFLALFTCVPVQKAWNRTTPGHCLDTHQTFLGATISNILVDFIILILPMPMLWQLHIETRRKFGLVGVFAAGYCVIILSILRLASIVDLGEKLQQDISWNLTTPQILVTCEIPIALLSSCLPSIFNLVKHAIRRHFSRLSGRLSASNPLSGPGGSHIGAIGNPIDDGMKSGFVQLQSDRYNTGASKERLFYHTAEGDHYTTASAAQQDPEMGIPLHQIHIREEVKIDAQRRP